jgi:hypothetical protein
LIALRFRALGLAVALAMAFGTGLAQAQSFDHGYAAWSALLAKHVVLREGGKSSQLDYAGMARDRAALKSWLASLEAVSEAQFAAWSRPERMAFLINAYNGFTVELILTQYPRHKSIRDYGSLFTNAWKQKFFRLFGREQTLDAVEHEMLRAPGAYEDVRLHFAVNCASIGCPMLREEAYVAARLDAQLEQQAQRFLSDRSRNRFDAKGGGLELSRIFDWYGKDWDKGWRGVAGGAPVTSLAAWLGRHAALLADAAEQRQLVAEGRAPIRFIEYDWALNDVARDPSRDTVRDIRR